MRRILNRALKGDLRDMLLGIMPAIRRIPSLSFSFYGEDVLLPHLKPQPNGFYVDVGAFDPRIHSNTYKLYLKGWHGVTVEPNPDAAARFRRARPRDLHLVMGIASASAELSYYKFRDPAQNTFDAKRATEVTAERVDEVKVRCAPLEEVFQQYCKGRQVDLLNVDCEARDLDVLHSLDWRHHRPTVLIVEDFEHFASGSEKTPSHSPIRTLMLANGYALAAQTFFSSFYVDRRGFNEVRSGQGFRLDESQFVQLATS